MVFYESFPGSRVWVGNKEINLKPMKDIEGRVKYVDIFFDPIVSKLWAWNRRDDSRYFFIVDITNGSYSSEKEIVFESPENEQPVIIFPNNNKALVQYSLELGLYGIIELLTGKQEILDIRDILKDLPGYQFTLGYNGEFIFFTDGYYRIEKKEYCDYGIYFFRSHQIYSITNDHVKTVGINKKNNEIISYDPYTGNGHKIYPGQKLLNLRNIYDFYLENTENGIIYAAESSFWNNFNFISQPPKLIWYMYDFNAGRKTKIHVPTDYAKILGRL
jgi:hypothetical protein